MTEKDKKYIEIIQKEKNPEEIMRFYDTIPRSDRTEAVILAAAKKDPEIFQRVPLQSWTKEVIRAAIDHSREYIHDIPFYNLTEPICYDLLQKYPSLIAELPTVVIHEKMCRELMDTYVKDFDSFLILFNTVPYPELREEMLQRFENLYIDQPNNFMLNIPESYCTEALLKRFFENDPSMYDYLPDSLKDYNRSYQAICQNGLLLEHVPDAIKTKDLCLAAYQNNPEAFPYIPDKFYDPQLALDIIKKYPKELHLIPKSYRSREVCEEACKTGNLSLTHHIPYPDLCASLFLNYPGTLSALKNSNLVSVNWKIIPLELAKTLIEKDPLLYPLLAPEVKNDPEVYQLAVSLNHRNISDVLEAKRTVEMYINAVKEEPYYLKWLPDHLKTQEVYRSLVRSNLKCFSLLSEGEISREICQDVLKTIAEDPYPYAAYLQNIPYYDLFMEGLKELKEPSLVIDLFERRLPESFLTEEMVMEGVKKTGFVLTAIKSQLFNQALCNQASETSPTVINWIPESFRTPEMYLRAVKEHPVYENYVPPGIRESENIYSFCKKTEAFLQKELAYNQAFHIYHGLPFQVDQLRTEAGIKQQATIRWDKEQNKFTECEPLKPLYKLIQKPSRKPKKGISR